MSETDEVIWVPFEDTIRERLTFDLDQIRGITNHMPRDVAEGYEASVTTALTALDSLLARLAAVEAERDDALGDLDNNRLYVAEYAGYAQIAKDALLAAEARVEALEAALRDVLDNLGGHDHWREYGAGGRCETCVRQSKAASRARAVLSSLPSGLLTPEPEQEGQ